jgi:hypothetical protein
MCSQLQHTDAQLSTTSTCLPRLLQGLGAWASFAHQITNLPTPEVDSFVKAAIFATLTNVSHQMWQERASMPTNNMSHPAAAIRLG